MMIRDFMEADIPRLEEILSAQGFSYEHPDWKKLFGGVYLDDQETTRILLLSRPTVECYAVVDLTAWGTPGAKAAAFERLDRFTVGLLRRTGYEDRHIWVPQQKRPFARRLQKMGWMKSAGPDEWIGLVDRF